MEKTAPCYSIKLKIYITHAPAFPVIDIFTWHAWTAGTAAFFMITRNWERPRCLSVGEWVKIVLHALEYYTAMKNEATSFM